MAETPVKVGDVLDGKYRVERVLGSGGMGVVVAARHVQLEQVVALKFLLPDALKDDEVVVRFAREARAAASIKSDHVARVIDVGKMQDGAPYMVMEYLDGRDMRQVLEAQGPLPIGDAVDYVLEACEALSEAHSQGIVHRDLKPANLFLTERSGKRPIIKVLDFGISKLMDDSEGTDLALTKTMTRLGSPLYMSPEQMSSPKHVNHRTDIWALGVILYEFVTAQRPFRGDSAALLIVSILNSAPDLPTKFRPDLPDGLEGVILRCLEKDPVHRYDSVGALAADLWPWSQKKDIQSLPMLRNSLDGRSSSGDSPRASSRPSGRPSPQSSPGSRISQGGASGATLPTTVSQSWKSIDDDQVLAAQQDKRGWTTVGGVAFGVAALVLVGLRFVSSPKDPASVGSQGPTSSVHEGHDNIPPSGPNVPNAVNGSSTSAPPLGSSRDWNPDPANFVRIRLSASPSTATIFLDGTPLPSNPFEGPMPRGKSRHTLRGEAPGYRPRESSMFFEQNGSFHLVLERETSDDGGRPSLPMGTPSRGEPSNGRHLAGDGKVNGSQGGSRPSPRSIDEESPYSQ